MIFNNLHIYLFYLPNEQVTGIPIEWEYLIKTQLFYSTGLPNR